MNILYIFIRYAQFVYFDTLTFIVDAETFSNYLSLFQSQINTMS